MPLLQRSIDHSTIQRVLSSLNSYIENIIARIHLYVYESHAHCIRRVRTQRKAMASTFLNFINKNYIDKNYIDIITSRNFRTHVVYRISEKYLDIIS